MTHSADRAALACLQAETLEKLNKGDIAGFVEEVQPRTVSNFLQLLYLVPNCCHVESVYAMPLTVSVLGSSCKGSLIAAAVHWPAFYAAMTCSADQSQH